jgi:hypothetical protein
MENIRLLWTLFFWDVTLHCWVMGPVCWHEMTEKKH